MNQWRFTPKVHEELRDRVACVAEDKDALSEWDDQDDAAALVSLHSKLDAAKPGTTIDLTAAEAQNAREYLLLQADVIDDNAEFVCAPSEASWYAKMGAEHAFATRLRNVAADLQDISR